ncbi:MAG: hypothetical protein ACJA1R_002155 [Flavobacteriales bacterium]|jgi:hypothetical protein
MMSVEILFSLFFGPCQATARDCRRPFRAGRQRSEAAPLGVRASRPLGDRLRFPLLGWVFASTIILLSACGSDSGSGGEDELRCEDVTLGGACGDCGDGVFVCGGGDLAACFGGTTENECGVCGVLAGDAGDSCGSCGVLACGADGGLACMSESDPNSCGGCVPFEERVGTACDDDADSVWTCTGEDALECRPLGANGCGGDATLSATPGTRCGTCGDGFWACDGTDAVACNVPEDAGNACGGCLPLEGEPGDTCGRCDGAWACDGPNQVSCDEPAPNRCGGCAALPTASSLECSSGAAACAGPDVLVCANEGANACGGETELDLDIGNPCGTCGDGIAICAGPDEAVCVGASETNVCGGCGFLPGRPNEQCAPLGFWVCEDNDLVCALGESANACGGTAALNDTPGDACGECDAGVVACAGFDDTRCLEAPDSRLVAWPDVDSDGYGDAAAEPRQACELGANLARNDGDCDDDNEAINPDAEEVCDGEDNDCNGATDLGAVDVISGFLDGDGDGFGQANQPRETCAFDDLIVSESGDCDDNDARVFPGAPELDCADPTDFNCDGETLYVDADGDGFAACIDCDDDATRNPGTLERCNGEDDNCNGETDEAGAIGSEFFYRDSDSDDHGDPNDLVFVCEAPDGFVSTGLDCEPTNGDIHPDADEVCDNIDNNCDERVDPDDSVDAPVWYVDGDEDGFGITETAQPRCEPILGNSLVPGDCDDRFPEIRPATAESPVTEFCDFIDNDCDGLEDEADELNPTTWFVDADSDGFGDTALPVESCVPLIAGAAPFGLALVDGDCDDARRFVNPHAAELPGDEFDENCDGTELCYVDADQDGYRPNNRATVFSDDLFCDTAEGEANAFARLLDCDDNSAARNPGATELVADRIESNCDGLELCYIDRDGDGFRSIPGDEYAGPILVAVRDTECEGSDIAAPIGAPATDCDDLNAGIHPNVRDTALNPVDLNCDGSSADIADSAFVSTTAGGSGGVCGAFNNPCSGLDAGLNWLQFEGCGSGGFSPPCGQANRELILEVGAYGGPENLRPGATIIGGFPVGFLGEHPGSGSRSIIGGELFDPFFDFNADGVTLQHLELAPIDGGDIATMSVTLSGGEFRLRDVLIIGEQADDSRAAVGAVAGSSVVLSIGGEGTLAASETSLVIGQGGNANAGGEAGSAFGLVLRSGQVTLTDDSDLEVVRREGVSRGGSGNEATTVACNRYGLVPGAICREWRVGLDARMFDTFIHPLTIGPEPGRDNQIFEWRRPDGVVTLYNRIDTPETSIETRRARCNAWGGDLATVNSAEEEQFIANALAAIDSVTGPRETELGLIAPDPLGDYEWDAADSDHENWLPGEPTDLQQFGCVRARTDDDGLVAWEVSECRTTLSSAICERPTGEFCVPGDPANTICGPLSLVCRSRYDDPTSGVCVRDSVELELADAFASAVSQPVENGQVFEILPATDWQSANDVCVAWDGELLEVDTDEEWNQARLLLHGVAQTSSMWIGLRSRGTSDLLDWPSGDTESIVIEPWAIGQPGRDGLGNMAMLTYTQQIADPVDESTGTALGWRASAAADSAAPYLCERQTGVRWVED